MSIALKQTVDELAGRRDVAASASPKNFVAAGVRRAAERNSMRLIAQANADVMNDALRRFVALLYEQEGGIWFNVDDVGRILIPTPWSRAKHTEYGLTDTSHRVLRRIIAAHNESTPAGHQLIFYVGQYDRSWYLNRRHYPTIAHANGWLDRYAITPEAWIVASRSSG